MLKKIDVETGNVDKLATFSIKNEFKKNFPKNKFFKKNKVILNVRPAEINSYNNSNSNYQKLLLKN